MASSMIYSVGTALSRAEAAGIPVEVLVGGTWIGGLIAAADGHGVVLEARTGEHSVIRIEAVQAVRVHAPLPDRPSTMTSVPVQVQHY